jgi:hypothetical protein
LTLLSGTASKSRGRQAGKPRELATSDEELGEQSGEEAAPQGPASQGPRPRAAYRTRSRSAELDAMSASEDGKSGGESRGKGKRRRSTASPPHLSQPRSASRGERTSARSSASVSSRSAGSSPEGEVTPKASRKRARVARHEEEEGIGGVEGGEGEGVTEGDDNVPNAEEQAASSSPARPPSRASSRASSAGAPEDFRVRRKRARH